MKQNWTYTRKTVESDAEYTYDPRSKKDVLVTPAQTTEVDNYELAYGTLDIVISGTPGDWVAEVTDITTGRPSSIVCDGFRTFEDAETWVLRTLYASASSATRALDLIEGGWPV